VDLQSCKRSGTTCPGPLHGSVRGLGDKEERPILVEMLGSKLVGPVAVKLAKRWAGY
jgi:hypothetical protein